MRGAKRSNATPGLWKASPSRRHIGFLIATLTGHGYRVADASEGPEALTQAAIKNPDLVLLDLNMPVKNGWDTFERLTFEHPLLPVIIVTGRPNQLFPALAGGAGGVQLQNANGVILQLSGPKVGVELSAAVAGVTIRLK